MMKENNNIFLAGSNAIVYLTKPVYKGYSTTFVWDHPFNTYVSYDQFFNPCSPNTHLYTFWMTPLHSPICIHNGCLISQPKNK